MEGSVGSVLAWSGGLFVGSSEVGSGSGVDGNILGSSGKKVE